MVRRLVLHDRRRIHSISRRTIVTPPSGGLGYLLARAAYYYKDMNLAIILLVFITFIVVYFNTLTWHRLMETSKHRHI